MRKIKPLSSSLEQFRDDYIISWDCDQSGNMCLAVSVVKKNEKGTGLVQNFLGISHATSGCVSLRQAISDYEERQRVEAQGAVDRERLRSAFKDTDPEKEADK